MNIAQVIIPTLIVAISALIGTAGLAQTETQPTFRHEFSAAIGPELIVDRAGFTAFSQSMSQKMAAEPIAMDIDPYEITLPFIARGIASNMKAKVKVNQVILSPRPGGINLVVWFDSIAVTIGSLRMENFFFPGIGSTCAGAGFQIGNGGQVKATARLNMGLSGEVVKLTMGNFNFDMASYQYQAYGPTRCHGGFIIGDLFTQVIAGEILQHAHGFVIDAMERQAHSIAEMVEEQLNAMSQMEFPLSIPPLVVLPPTAASLSMAPGQLTISSEAMRLKLSLTVNQLADGELPESSGDNSGFTDAALAAVHFQESLVDALLGVLHQENRLTFEATADMHPMFAAFKDKEQMASFIPDLGEIALDSEELRVFVEPQVAPDFVTAMGENTLGLALSDMNMRFQVLRNGEWQDYFIMTVNLNFGLTPQDVAGQIHLTMVPGSAVVSGGFAAGYEPSDSAFDAEGMAAFFQALMDVLERTGEPFVVDRPVMPVAGFELAPHNLQVAIDGLRFDIIEKLPE